MDKKLILQKKIESREKHLYCIIFHSDAYVWNVYNIIQVFVEKNQNIKFNH